MAIKYRIYTPWWLTLISRDVMGNGSNHKIATDLFRRSWASFAVNDSPGVYYVSPDDLDVWGEDERCYILSKYTSTVSHITRDSWTDVVLEATEGSPQIDYVGPNPSRMNIIDSRVIIPNGTIPFRIYASDVPGAVQGDVHWKTFFMGGDWNGETLPKRYDPDRVYYDLSTAISYPADYHYYSAAEKLGSDVSKVKQFSVATHYEEYNNNVQQYQDWALEQSSELLIPNMNFILEYILLWRQGDDRTTHRDPIEEPSGFGEEYTFDEEKDRVKNLQQAWTPRKSKLIEYHFPAGAYYETLKKDQYFGTYFPNVEKDSELQQIATEAQQNIMMDHMFFYKLTDDEFVKWNNVKELALEMGYSKELKLLSTFYNVEIKFNRHGNIATNLIDPDWDEEREDGGFPARSDASVSNVYPYIKGAWEDKRTKQTMRHAIEKARFSARLLELLKDYDEGTITDINRKKFSFTYNISTEEFKDQLTNPSEVVYTRHEHPAENINLNSVNFLELLIYAFNNADAELNKNYLFLSNPYPESRHYARSATSFDATLARSTINKSIGLMVDKSVEYVRHHMSSLGPEAYDMYDVMENRGQQRKILDNLVGPNYHHHEVLVYKIEKYKVGERQLGDTDELIQKFWVYNSTDAPPEINFFDSQVKFGQYYKYKISAYTVILGHKYKYGDLRLTKQIGIGNYLGAEDSGLEYCLQFYDPTNDQVASQLYSVANFTLAEDDPMRSTLSTLNELADNSVEITEHPQVADFNLYIEPCLELVEIPMFEKTIKVMDYLPNAIRVTPFHFIDNSNRVGFQIGQESFIERPYPEIITPQDIIDKADFLNSKEIAQYNLIDKFSESPARFIEMYRIKHRPNSFLDFKDGLVSTIDLRIKNDVYNYSNKIISDKINTNTKYYYLFRFVNENGQKGAVSQIIECELVNDGGYTYALFDTVDSSEFNPNKITTKVIPFKKMLQLDPNINQITVIDDEVDYNDSASNQIDNITVGNTESKLFDGKKFKIRLTSKKTNKKIDLNIEYNMLRKDLSKFPGTPIPPEPEGFTVPYSVLLNTAELWSPFTISGLDITKIELSEIVEASTDFSATPGAYTRLDEESY